MEHIDVQTGDVFCVRGKSVLMRIIRLAERIISRDDRADYGHAGIILSPGGATYEALWTLDSYHLDAYRGQPIIIARPTATAEVPVQPIFRSDKVEVLKHLIARTRGRWYPVWRLPLHFVPWLARYLSTGQNVVCSEITAEYLRMIGARPEPSAGINPDMLADEWRRWKNFEIIFEGVWK